MPNLRRLVSATTLALFPLAFSSCDDVLDLSSSGGGGSGSGSTRVGDIQPLDAAPRVDLPGRVSVFFRVVSPSGKGVADLTESDFQLLEDGNTVSMSESQQRLLSKPQVFSSYSLLLLDRSGSIAQSPTGEQEEIDAATAYIDLVTSQSPQSFIALAWFDGEAHIRPVLLDDFSELGFSNDRARLLEAIQNLHDQAPSSTSTNLYGAIVAGLAELDEVDLRADAAGIEFRALALVTFTDGTDQAGTTPLQSAIARVREVDPKTAQRRYSVFSIGLGNEIDESVLRQLGPEGSAFATSFAELTPQFEVVAQGVRDVANSFYFLSYCSPKQNGSGDHVLTVRAVRDGDVAEEDYEFSADYFSGGCGFVDVIDALMPGESQTIGDLTQDATGRVLVCGGRVDAGSSPESTLFVARFSADGVLDRTFGIDGVTTLGGAFGLTSVQANALAVDVDGTLVVGGAAGTGDLPFGRPSVALWRLGTDGQVLSERLLPLHGADGDWLADLAIDSQRRIVACGRAGVASPRTAVWRFGSDLALDTSFHAPDGYLLHRNQGSPADSAEALVLLPGDAAVIVGSGRSAALSAADAKMLKVTAAGELDPTFGTDGLVMNDAFQAAQPGRALCVARDGAGRIVVGGFLYGGGAPKRPALWRLTAAGRPDTTFLGSPFSHTFATGLATLPQALLADPDVNFSQSTVIRGLTIHSDDSILAVGRRTNAEGNDDVTTWRFDRAGMLAAAYNGTGFLIEDGSSGDDSSESGDAVRILRDGRILAAGSSTHDGTSRAILWLDSEVSRVFGPWGQN